MVFWPIPPCRSPPRRSIMSVSLRLRCVLPSALVMHKPNSFPLFLRYHYTVSRRHLLTNNALLSTISFGWFLRPDYTLLSFTLLLRNDSTRCQYCCSIVQASFLRGGCKLATNCAALLTRVSLLTWRSRAVQT